MGENIFGTFGSAAQARLAASILALRNMTLNDIHQYSSSTSKNEGEAIAVKFGADVKDAERFLLTSWPIRAGKKAHCRILNVCGGTDHLPVHSGLLFKTDESNIWCRVDLSAEEESDGSFVSEAVFERFLESSMLDQPVIDGIPAMEYHLYTSLSDILDAVQDVMNTFGEYNLLNNNCNHFCHKVLEILKLE